MHTYEYRGYVIQIDLRHGVYAYEDKEGGNWFTCEDTYDAERTIDRIRDDEEADAAWERGQSKRAAK